MTIALRPPALQVLLKLRNSHCAFEDVAQGWYQTFYRYLTDAQLVF
jgi:hypothetical protein